MSSLDTPKDFAELINEASCIPLGLAGTNEMFQGLGQLIKSLVIRASNNISNNEKGASNDLITLEFINHLKGNGLFIFKGALDDIPEGQQFLEQHPEIEKALHERLTGKPALSTGEVGVVELKLVGQDQTIKH